jgi:hypothetical protein
MLWILSPQVPKKTVDGAQTHIAGANAVSATSFQALQKRRDVIDAEIFHRQFTGVAFLASGELYEEFKTVAVALKGQGTQGPLTRHVIDEEAV